MRILVCGSRGFDNYELMLELFQDLGPDTTIVHGGARGADALAGNAARAFGLSVEEHPADWDTHGKSAGYRRNVEMLDSGVDLVWAFWDGESRGTAHTIREAKQRGIRVSVIR